jgi:rod shape-determining protein MreD
MRRTATIFVTLAVLWTIVAQVNHALAPWHIYLWVGGLFVTFGALALPLRAGLAASLLGGLLCDATSGTNFGAHALLFASAHIVIFNVRDRVPRDETIGRVVIALLANLALFLVFSFLQIARLPEPGDAWPRLIFDLLCSQVFLAVIAPWFFAFQSRLLDLADPIAADYDRRLD